MPNIAKIKNWDVANGIGIRTSIFFSGCEFGCPNCFNSDIWDFNKGKPFTRELYETEIKPTINEHIAGLSILGGEALHPKNLKAVRNLVDWFSQDFPDKSIWVWSGYSWTELMERCKKSEEDDLSWILCNIDVLVDGRFIESQKDLSLKFRGSRNQRIIDVSKTLEKGKIILYNK